MPYAPIVFLSALSLAAWLYLAFGRSGFWRTDQRLEPMDFAQPEWPAVDILIPARNEGDLLDRTLPCLLSQDYPGPFHIYLIDDRSEDATGALARQIVAAHGSAGRLTVVAGSAPPAGWTGKLWALEQGIRTAQGGAAAPYLLFTDADIVHPPESLRLLVSQAAARRLDLVSLMVMLQAGNRWEKLWLAAFVYFFAKLYPFRRVNADRSPTAAAAGGVLLVRRQALAAAGGLPPLAAALIDDCALAARIKHRQGRPGRIWLGLSAAHRSVRPYGGLRGVWEMVARTAYTQLRYSPLLLATTVTGMVLLYLLPPLSALFGLLAGLGGEAAGWGIALAGFGGWAVMSFTFLPMSRWYEASAWQATLLPLAGLLYTSMTLDSARRHRQGRGGAWKGRFHRKPAGSP